MSMRPIFVTRKFPPSVGGMETLSLRTAEALRASSPGMRLIALGRRNIHLLWWMPTAAFRLLWACLDRRDRVVLFGDALTAAVLGAIPRMLRIPVVAMVMGLDITYTNPMYRAVVLPALRRFPVVLAISTATKEAAVSAGLDEGRVRVIVLGLPPSAPPAMTRAAARRELERRFDLREDAVVLATTGRLIRRKGVRWFTEHVLPRLSPRFAYLVVGDGPDREQIQAAIPGAGHDVRLLGRVDDETRALVLQGADVYVQPNIKVPGDMEGFGLAVTEASQAGLLTVAADLEGLRDAVRDGQTGVRVPSGDAEAWVTVLEQIARDAGRSETAAAFQQAALREYSVTNMASQLTAALETARRQRDGS